MKFPLRYFISLSALVLGSVAIVWLLSFQVKDLPMPSLGHVTVPMLYLFTFLSHQFIFTASIWKGKPFVQMVMISMIIRLTLYLLFVMILILVMEKNVRVDIVYFGILYLVLTVHEVIWYLKMPFENQT